MKTQKKSSPSYYGIAPAYILHSKEINSGEKILLIHILALSNLKGFCWANNTKLAEAVGITTVTIRAFIAHLLELGFIKISYDDDCRMITPIERHIRQDEEDEEPKHKKKIPKAYRRNDFDDDFDVKSYENEEYEEEKSDKDKSEVVEASEEEGTQNKKNEKQQTAAEIEFKNKFEEFWDKYPKKVQKLDARKAFKKVLKTVTHDQIMYAISEYGKIWREQCTEMKFIPHPSTWLNRGGYTDDELNGFKASAQGSQQKQSNTSNSHKKLSKDEETLLAIKRQNEANLERMRQMQANKQDNNAPPF